MKDKGDLDGAKELLREALQARRDTLGDRHPDTLGSINNFGLLLYAKGDLDGAKEHYRVALQAGRLDGRLSELTGQKQLELAVAEAADAAVAPVDALADAIPPGRTTEQKSPLAGKLMCKLAIGLNKFATRCKAALPQLQYVAQPLGKMLAAAASVNDVAQELSRAFASPLGMKEVIIEKVTKLLKVLREHPMELVHEGVDLLKGLADKLRSESV